MENKIAQKLDDLIDNRFFKNSTLLHRLKNNRLTIKILVPLIIGVSLIATVLLVNKGVSFLISRAQTASSSLIMSPTSSSVNVGQTLTANILLSPNNNPVSGVDVVLNYDTAHLRATAVSPNSSSGFANFSYNIDATNGRVLFSAIAYDGNTPTTPVSGSALIQLANVTFIA
jgi:hypothetical protein